MYFHYPLIMDIFISTTRYRHNVMKLCQLFFNYLKGGHLTVLRIKISDMLIITSESKLTSLIVGFSYTILQEYIIK